jgi:hypothetical protein
MTDFTEFEGKVNASLTKGFHRHPIAEVLPSVQVDRI